MNTTEAFRTFISQDLAMLAHADTMYKRSQNNDSRTVIFYGIAYLRNRVGQYIQHLGGMAAAW